ncbi:MAG: NPCBM/NEW2 domain-containing protein [Planctomycetes bacterium]|nr:NPCBM/NEW2 domain-containing protein [Planctomycetota bacterium]
MLRSRVFGVVLLGSIVAEPAFSEVTVRSVDGRRLTAEAVALAGKDALRLTGGEAVTLPLTDVVSVEFSAPRERASAAWDVVLVDGSRLVGALAAADEDEVAIETTEFGVLRLPLDLVGSVSRGGAAIAARSDDELDHVTRKSGDALSGTVTSVGAAGVRVDGDLGAVTLALDDVERVVIAHVDESAPFQPALAVALVAVGGSELRADLLGLDRTRVEVATVFARSLSIALEHVVALRLGAARAEYLSDLTPTAVSQAPYFGGADDFLFPWQRDRSVTGAQLVVGGRTFTKGLGLHARTRLTYALDGRYERLEAVVGVSDEVLALDAKGSIEFRFVVDGTPSWTSPVLRGGDPAVEMPALVLAGARELVVEVDFADGADSGDRAVIGDALLVKK